MKLFYENSKVKKLKALNNSQKKLHSKHLVWEGPKYVPGYSRATFHWCFTK